MLLLYDSRDRDIREEPEQQGEKAMEIWKREFYELIEALARYFGQFVWTNVNYTVTNGESGHIKMSGNHTFDIFAASDLDSLPEVDEELAIVPDDDFKRIVEGLFGKHAPGHYQYKELCISVRTGPSLSGENRKVHVYDVCTCEAVASDRHFRVLILNERR